MPRVFIGKKLVSLWNATRTLRYGNIAIRCLSYITVKRKVEENFIFQPQNFETIYLPILDLTQMLRF